MSDIDVYGWTIPAKEVVFPHLAGVISGFGEQGEVFKNFQQHHIKDASVGRVYDVDIYNIVRYFQLCMENNPNMIDSLFVPQRCILHMTPVAQMVRERRREFLHKGAFHKLRGYAFSQMSKMDVKKQDVPEVHALWALEDELKIPHTVSMDDVHEECKWRASSSNKFDTSSISNERSVYHKPNPSGVLKNLDDIELHAYVNAFVCMMNKNKRLEGIKRWGFDVKFAYHVIRLASQAEQILVDGDLNLEEPGRREHMKAVRRGEVSQDDIRAWFTSKERDLETLYANSKLRVKPDEGALKQLLLDCLEHHYGSLSATITIPGEERRVLDQIGQIMDRWRARE